MDGGERAFRERESRTGLFAELSEKMAELALAEALCVVVPAVTGISMASLVGKHGWKGLKKVRGKVMYTGKVLEEDGEEQQVVHAMEKGALGMIPPMPRN
ncbi:hypothetical protein llap_12 [Limosa lapponica baueri]|uniref:Uncharacterized protein n=1 Tax=Limosa lapponica baueri TaxID=1758121 RepID=A0A2I0UUD8_LIMLA|nr:hypothetical protein llap_12 [Limosa lapponica baueri]